MEARAVEKFIRISPRKVKYVADLVRNKSVEEAVEILSLTPRRAAVALKKAIQSAAANAVENHKMKEENLYISRIMINEGPTLKRFIPRARGRADRILKRTSHIFVYVSERVSLHRKPESKPKEVSKSGAKGKS
ncbi:MAG: 50S ribosomal protein L22 [Actinobacteria bacterium]|nr:50S ribosomal protein L22 [Actinomycetota bacterium]